MVHLKDLPYGVEIETVGQTRETVARAIQTVVGGTVRHLGTPACFDPWTVTMPDGRVWSVVADSSLHDAAPDRRAEVVSPILTWDDMETLQAVIRALRAAGAKATATCGLHTHVDASRFDGRTLAILAKQVYANEELIFKAFAVSDDRKARYTKPLDPAFITRLQAKRPHTREEFLRCWYDEEAIPTGKYHQSRYALVNFHATACHGTVEYRAYTPDGLHAGKIKAAIVFSLALCARALNCRAAAAKKKAYDARSARYDMRVQLLHLGLIGDEYKNVRKHILALMPGSAAWKYGRPVATTEGGR